MQEKYYLVWIKKSVPRLNVWDGTAIPPKWLPLERNFLSEPHTHENSCYLKQNIEDIQMFLLNMSFISRVKWTIFIFHEWRSHE